MNIEHVRPGDPLDIPATAYNAFVDAARAHRRGAPPPAMPTPHAASQSLVRIRNDTGKNLPIGSIVGLEGAPLAPYPLEPHALAGMTFSGVVPTTEIHRRTAFAILTQPARAGEIALACVSGACFARISWVGSRGLSHAPFERSVSPVTGNTDHLTIWSDAEASAPWTLAHGPVSVIWCQDWTSTVTAQPAIVRIGSPAPTGPFMAVMIQANHYYEIPLYDVRDPRPWRNRTILTGVDPANFPHIWRRPAVRGGTITPATMGLVQHIGGQPIILWTNETYDHPHIPFPVSLSVTGGGNGGEHSLPTWRYNVFTTDPIPRLILADVDPTAPPHYHRRAPGLAERASGGLAIVYGDSYRILQINEVARWLPPTPPAV